MFLILPILLRDGKFLKFLTIATFEFCGETRGDGLPKKGEEWWRGAAAAEAGAGGGQIFMALLSSKRRGGASIYNFFCPKQKRKKNFTYAWNFNRICMFIVALGMVRKNASGSHLWKPTKVQEKTETSSVAKV